MKLFIFAFLLADCVWAQTLPLTSEPYPTEKSLQPLPGTLPKEESSFEKAVESAQKVPVPQAVVEEAKSTKDLREKSQGTAMLGYELITSWIPFKKTISYTHIFNSKWSLEGEYAWSTLSYPIVGVDLGSISEKRLSLMARYYPGNSFHYSFGPYFNDFEAQAGSDILNRVSGARTTSSFGVEGLGVTAGLGNRWQWNNGFTLDIDWMRLNVPLIVTEVDSQILSAVTNREDDQDLRKVIRRLNRIPTFVLLGLSIGYTF